MNSPLHNDSSPLPSGLTHALRSDLPNVSLLYPLGMLAAVKINAKGREVIYLAKGDSVKLGCPYELEPEDLGPNGLDIEWTQINSDPTNLDTVVSM